MPLRFTSERTFNATCKAAGGETFHARFRVLTDEEVGMFFSAASGNAPLEDQKAFLRRAVCELSDLVDDAGAPIPFTAELLEQALGMADMRLGMLEGYRIGLTGAKAGN